MRILNPEAPLKSVCSSCFFLTGNGEKYRCKVPGTCPAVSIKPSAIARQKKTNNGEKLK